MPTVIKEVPGFRLVAQGNNIQTVQNGGRDQFLVSAIQPFPNDDLIVGNSYSLTDAVHRSLATTLQHAPGGGMMTAVFVRAE